MSKTAETATGRRSRSQTPITISMPKDTKEPTPSLKRTASSSELSPLKKLRQRQAAKGAKTSHKEQEASTSDPTAESTSSQKEQEAITTVIPQSTTSDPVVGLATMQEIAEYFCDDSTIINDATEVEQEWWLEGTNTVTDSSRLPLRLVSNVTYEEFVERAEAANALRFWDFFNGDVIVYELPLLDHEAAHRRFAFRFETHFANLNRNDELIPTGSLTCIDQAGRKKEADSGYFPRRIPRPSLNPCDNRGTPWPTIVIEACLSESLRHIDDKVNNFWLAPNRCEDVIVLKVGAWVTQRRDNTGRPLRHMTCYHYCRRRSPRINGRFKPFATIEFGTVYRNGKRYNGCSGRGMRTVSIDLACVYAGCPGVPPYPLPGPIVVDLFDVQDVVFS